MLLLLGAKAVTKAEKDGLCLVTEVVYEPSRCVARKAKAAGSSLEPVVYGKGQIASHIKTHADDALPAHPDALRVEDVGRISRGPEIIPPLNLRETKATADKRRNARSEVEIVQRIEHQ